MYCHLQWFSVCSFSFAKSFWWWKSLLLPSFLSDPNNFVRYFFFTPTEITWANQLDNSKYDKIWNIWWKSQTKCSQTRMLQDSNQIPRIVHCFFFSFFFACSLNVHCFLTRICAQITICYTLNSKQIYIFVLWIWY